MNISHSLCPVCKSKDNKKYTSLKKLPAILFPIECNKRHTVKCEDISTFICLDCNHIYINELDPCFSESIYKDYYYLYPFKDLESMNSCYRDPFVKIFDLFWEEKYKTLLEIGCDDEAQMGHFLKKNIICTAINPGAKPHNDIRFIDGFYGVDNISGKFNFIVSRFNLEHILDLDIHIEKIKNNLEDGGKLIIQVPNAEYFINNNILNILAHEHPHYFCQQSLITLFQERGFNINYINSENEPSLICVISNKNNNEHFFKYPKTTENIITSIVSLLEGEEYETILYGAGLPLTGIIYSELFKSVKQEELTIIDDNPILYNKYMPASDVRISSPAEIDLGKYKKIIITVAYQYHHLICNKLLELQYKGQIIGIKDNGLIYYQN